jgi:hypothetical protein
MAKKFKLIIKWMNGCEEKLSLSPETHSDGVYVSYFEAKDFLEADVADKGRIRIPLQNVMYYYCTED